MNTTKQERRHLLARIDVLENKRCKTCSEGSSNTNLVIQCQCEAAVKIRELGAQYEAIATRSRLDRKQKLMNQLKQGITVELYFELLEQEVQIREIERNVNMTKMAFAEWRMKNGLMRGQEKAQSFVQTKVEELEKAELPPVDSKQKEKLDEYKHWRKIAESNGIKAKTFQSRVRVHSMSYERAATMPLKKGTTNPWVKRAQANDIPLRTYRQRLESGWSQEQASSLPPWTRVNKRELEESK